MCTKGGTETSSARRRGIAPAGHLGWLSSAHDESNGRFMISTPAPEAGTIPVLSCRFAGQPGWGAR
jgi:hypothetical protein